MNKIISNTSIKWNEIKYFIVFTCEIIIITIDSNMKKKKFVIKNQGKKMRRVYQPFVRSISRPFDFTRVECNATPTPRSPLLDAFLVKILVLYCSTLINARNARPPASSHALLWITCDPVTLRCHLSNICKQKMVIDNGWRKMNGFPLS